MRSIREFKADSVERDGSPYRIAAMRLNGCCRKEKDDSGCWAREEIEREQIENGRKEEVSSSKEVKLNRRYGHSI